MSSSEPTPQTTTATTTTVTAPIPLKKNESPSPPPVVRNRSPNEGDPAIRRRLSQEHSKHIAAARSLREIIKNLVFDTYGITVVGLKRLSAFKDVNFVIDGIMPTLESVAEFNTNANIVAVNGSSDDALPMDTTNTTPTPQHNHQPAQRTDSSRHPHHHHHHPSGPVVKLLLKMLNEEESNKDAMVNLVDGQTTLARHLHARGFPTHVPLASKSGALFEILPVPFAEFLLYHIDKTTDHESVMTTLTNSLVRLFPYLPGVPLADAPELGEPELHDVGAMLAMLHNSIVEDDFDHSSYRFWSSYLDDDDLQDSDEQQLKQQQQSDNANKNLMDVDSGAYTHSRARKFSNLVKRRMSRDEANRIMPFWSFDKLDEGREAGDLYVYKQNRKQILKLAFDQCEKVLRNKTLLKKLPKAAVHGDFNPWNLLVDQPNSTPRTSTSSDSLTWGVPAVAAAHTEPQTPRKLKAQRVDSLTTANAQLPPLSAPLTLGRYKLNGIIDFGESHYTFLIFDIAISLSSVLDVMYSRQFQHPTTPESSAISDMKSLDFSQSAVQASAARRAAEAASLEPPDSDAHDAIGLEEHDPMYAEAARKVEKWFCCFLRGYETKRELSQDERDAVIPLVLGWEAMAIALSKKELAKQPENRYVQSFCGDQDWRRLSSFLKIFPKVEAATNSNGGNNNHNNNNKHNAATGVGTSPPSKTAK